MYTIRKVQFYMKKGLMHTIKDKVLLNTINNRYCCTPSIKDTFVHQEIGTILHEGTDVHYQEKGTSVYHK